MHTPESLDIEELLFDFRYSRDVKPQFDGLTMPELMRAGTPELVYIEPAASVSVDLNLDGSGIMCRDVMGTSSVDFMRNDEAAPPSGPIDVTITDNGFEVPGLGFEEFQLELPFGSFNS